MKNNRHYDLSSTRKMTSSYSKGVEANSLNMISGYYINNDDLDFPSPLNVWIDTKDIIGTTATSDGGISLTACAN